MNPVTDENIDFLSSFSKRTQGKFRKELLKKMQMNPSTISDDFAEIPPKLNLFQDPHSLMNVQISSQINNSAPTGLEQPPPLRTINDQSLPQFQSGQVTLLIQNVT